MGLTATSFQLVDPAANTVGAANPDFGAGFRLGFGQRFSAGGSLPSRIVFDDVSIAPNVTPAPVPEPGSLGLLLGGLIACGMARRRR